MYFFTGRLLQYETLLINTEAATGGVLLKNEFFEISQN